MSYGTETAKLMKGLSLDKRKNSPNWYARLTLPNGKREVKSTGTDDFDKAKVRANEIYYETNARIKNSLPPATRKFKHVAAYAIERMQKEIDAGNGKQSYGDYKSAINLWLMPFFGNRDVAKIDLASLTKFDQWRTDKHTKRFSQSGINNHNAALNRIFDEAELRGWMVKSMRPTLLNKGLKAESRGSFTKNEYKSIYKSLESFHKHTKNNDGAATREVLRNYVLFLANTGIRHGTEALGMKWGNINWHHINREKYLAINVEGKTNKRTAIARDQVEGFLTRQAKLNPNIAFKNFDRLRIDAKDEFVWLGKNGKLATIRSLNYTFNKLLGTKDLKVGADGKDRTLYSFRHYYATENLQNGITAHALSRQMGSSTNMLDKHYSKASPLINADLHSGRSREKARRAAETPNAPLESSTEAAFTMIADGKLTEDNLLLVIGVGHSGYKPTEEIKLLTLKALAENKISEAAMIKLLSAGTL